MWVADSSDEKIYSYDLATKGRAPPRDFDTLIAAGNDWPLGIWSDGMTMWVADNSGNKLYAYHMP
jgi:sugar lactone lactonase YvrE